MITLRLKENDVFVSYLKIDDSAKEMARKAKIYDCVFESNGAVASSLIEKISVGLCELITNKAEYALLESKIMGTGSWKYFVLTLSQFLDDCKNHPNSLAYS